MECCTVVAKRINCKADLNPHAILETNVTHFSRALQTKCPANLDRMTQNCWQPGSEELAEFVTLVAKIAGNLSGNLAERLISCLVEPHNKEAPVNLRGTEQTLRSKARTAMRVVLRSFQWQNVLCFRKR